MYERGESSFRGTSLSTRFWFVNARASRTSESVRPTDAVNALVVAPDGDVVAGGATDSDFGACSSGLMDVWVARVAPEKAHAFFSQLDHEHAATHDCPGANKEGGVTRKNG